MAERKRATGFVLMDAAFAADAKFMRLARKAKSPHDYAAAVGVFWLLLGDARRAKSPVIDWDDYEEYVLEIGQLRDARLLQEDGFDPEVFERWAPAYKSPFDRTRAYPSVPDGSEGTQSTNTSSQVSSGQVPSNGGRGAGGGGTFMGYKPWKDSEGGAGLWHGKSTHDGRHGETCQVCFPPAPSEKGRPA